MAKIEAFRRRMGWRFKWVSSYGSDFNYDFHVSFKPDEIAQGEGYYNYELRDVGIDECPAAACSTRTRQATSSTPTPRMPAAARCPWAATVYLDMTPKGRDETINGNLTDWVRHHDRYDDAASSCHSD